MGTAIPGKIVRKIIFDILIERSNATDDDYDELIKKGDIGNYVAEVGTTACGIRSLADDILEGIMSLEEAVEVLTPKEIKDAKTRCQNWLNEKSKDDIEK